ncbi:MAG: Tim44/TimA family putative adaptor protein [Kiloniellaceae bacterium]
MSDGFQFLDIVLFAAIAAFFVLRLRSVLGKRTGHEKRPNYDRLGKRKGEPAEDEKVIPLPDRSASGKGGEPGEEGEEAPAAAAEGEELAPVAAGLTQIKLADKNFDEEQFLSGARAAFEMTVSAYAQGEKRALRPLLSNDVYDEFAGAIEERQKAGHTLETTLVGTDEAAIVEAELQGRTAFVTVKFVSQQINVVRDQDGNVVDGDPNQVTKITDIWTFARNTRSRDPNWTLVATQSPN